MHVLGAHLPAASIQCVHPRQLSPCLQSPCRSCAWPLSASQLAQMINEKPQLINEYESGKAIPNPQVRCTGLVRALCVPRNGHDFAVWQSGAFGQHASRANC